MRRTLAFWLGVFALFLLLASKGFHEDDVECEEAIARLVRCCPMFPATSVSCEEGDGCDGNPLPALALPESHCIEALSCDEILAAEICERVEAIIPPLHESSDGGVTEPRVPAHLAVCP